MTFILSIARHEVRCSRIRGEKVRNMNPQGVDGMRDGE